ncbi:hypothetical protein SS50377_23661 [Spironucleus salmonicida]|uniref:Uncharacterized protein n=1 Tax=Spironucleus salmonicida TaxID=348837 RepID=V6M5K5_9EUKA|nr:hypothetical protein SS50377_23661 [Spironucleus salmonicida]|eukprot:EST48644.1 Hypothetical protein SS50377_11257 [Spironucleus salmonicida]
MPSQLERFQLQQLRQKKTADKNRILEAVVFEQNNFQQKPYQLQELARPEKNRLVRSNQQQIRENQPYLQSGIYFSFQSSQMTQSQPLFRRQSINLTDQIGVTTKSKQKPVNYSYTQISVAQFKQEFDKIARQEALMAKSNYFQTVLHQSRSMSRK